MASAARATVRRPAGAPRRSATIARDPQHGLEDDEGDGDRRHHPIAVAGRLVDVGEVLRPLIAGRRTAGHGLEATALHRVRALDPGQVEDGGGDVDEGDEPGATGAPRPQQPGLDPGAAHAGHREVDRGLASGRAPPPAPSRAPGRRTRGAAPRGRRSSGAPRDAPPADGPGAATRHVAIGAGEVGALHQHDAAAGPGLLEGRRHPRPGSDGRRTGRWARARGAPRTRLPRGPCRVGR